MVFNYLGKFTVETKVGRSWGGGDHIFSYKYTHACEYLSVFAHTREMDVERARLVSFQCFFASVFFPVSNFWKLKFSETSKCHRMVPHQTAFAPLPTPRD